MATQAEEHWRLMQQIVGHGTVRVVTNTAVFGHRGMFPHKWPRQLGMTLKAQLIQRRGN
jgi:hypothetical protein